ncbi:hypothetical protein [Parapedobacter indicus]|uniref:Uncharacterized protein n=1 Tax=Parapedobacter indicus TaxID=1477437 RepID=A0A1I3E0G2_9SPHI|nr:hypothetical protein [Parapedobacter indicus]PPL04918.1 hypothetical protein CLV26_101728 [Parapedobacter indicus]SFH92456.1 hypothetical protein SAMN05444682_101714 [Parapedobacter indicus]
MSHFTVMVIGNDPEKQLAPYQENNMGDCPKEYLKFNDIEAEHRETYSTDETTVFVSPEGETLSKYQDRFRVSDGLLNGSNYVCPEGWTEKEILVSELYPTFEQYMSEYCGYAPSEDGRFGYWENPNAKWDWYQLGGRWTGHLKLKQGAVGTNGEPGLFRRQAKPGYTDQAKLEDIDLKGMRDEARADAIGRYDRLAELFGGEIPRMDFMWETLLADKGLTIEQKHDTYHNQSAMQQLKVLRESSKDDRELRDFLFFLKLEDYQLTREEYASKAANEAISTFAIIKDGNWHQRGEMGWWGIVSNEMDASDWNTEFNKLLDSLPGDTLISVYDCHI